MQVVTHPELITFRLCVQTHLCGRLSVSAKASAGGFGCPVRGASGLTCRSLCGCHTDLVSGRVSVTGAAVQVSAGREHRAAVSCEWSLTAQGLSHATRGPPHTSLLQAPGMGSSRSDFDVPFLSMTHTLLFDEAACCLPRSVHPLLTSLLASRTLTPASRWSPRLLHPDPENRTQTPDGAQ